MRKCICILAVLLCSLGVCALSWADINDGLVAHYPFNGNALDESGNGNDGIVHGATLIADRHGNTDSAYHFDGVNDYIYIQYDTSLVPANYTVVVWYYADSFKVGEIITKGIDKHYYQIQFESPKTGTNTIEFWYEDQLDKDYYILSKVGYDIDKHFMAAMIFDDLSLSAYINGQLIEEKVFSVAPYDNGDGLYIGKGNHDYFHGVIDDVRIYNRALSEAEIQELYNVMPVVMPVGTLLYRTSGDNEMPGRVGSPGYETLSFPYLQIPCAIYWGLLNPYDYPPTRTGHVAVYIGEIDGEHRIIEASGNSDGAKKEIKIAPLDTFINEENGQVFIGAKFPTGRDVHGRALPDNWQANIVGLAKEHKEEGYDIDFNRQKGENRGDWICVGFAEKLYESCNLEPQAIGERPLSYLDPYPYANGTEFYNGYDITRDGFYDSGDAGGLTNSYSYSGNEGFFKRCGEMCDNTVEFPAFTTFSNSLEFSQVTHPRNDESPTTCGFFDTLVGRENNSKHYIFWPYTQFKQDTLKSIRTTLDVGTTVINIIGGPSKDNPVSVSPLNTKQIELEVEVLDNGNQVPGLDVLNFIVSLEKNEDGRCVRIRSNYDDVTKKISFSSDIIPYTNIECGTYEIRVDYRDNNWRVRSSYSQDNALIISNAPPTVTTTSATSVTSTSATLNGTVNPNGEATTYYFEYGVDTSYGFTTSSSSAGSGTSPVTVTASIHSLISDTTYHYRLVATNSQGTSYGDDKTFNATILYIQVKANGQNGPIVVSPSTAVAIDISLDPGNRAGELADWWIAAKTPFAPPGDWYTYVYPTGWKPGINLCVQTPLFALSPFEVLNMTLPAGDYTFYFAIDDPDRAATGPWWGLGLVEVTVQ